MADRYLASLGDREPALVGGGDADEGPAGPPNRARPGVPAEE
jgi:hypothetical protein